MRRWLAPVALIAIGGCARSDDDTPQTSPAEQATAAVQEPAVDATDLFALFECHRCHDGLPVEPLPRDKHCVQCHRDIHDGSFEAPDEALQRWRRNIVSLRYAPSLGSVGARLRRDWVRDHLLDPVDLRPALPASMPRLAMTAEQAGRIAAHLVPREAEPRQFSARDIAAGRTLYRELGCASCHRFTGVDGAGSPATYLAGEGMRAPRPAAVALAPDLLHARDRLQSGTVEQWLANPAALAPDTLMPGFGLSRDQARAVAAFVMLAPLDPPAPPPLPRRLPVLERPVRYDEVAEKVLRKTCWHCHAEPDLARGDGGPGNSGGFGFAPRGLDLSSYTGVASGSLDDRGQRRSLFLRDDAGGTPRLVTVLLARQREEAGAAVPDVRGMPLGLPALSPEQIQLVDSWIAQGRPR